MLIGGLNTQSSRHPGMLAVGLEGGRPPIQGFVITPQENILTLKRP